MNHDFSVYGREQYLCQNFYELFDLQLGWEFSFARQTLLERVIWLFKSDNTYCTLDGFDLDEFHHFEDGFIGVGRARHLSDSIREEIPTIMAIEFNRFKGTVKRGLVWVGQKSPQYLQPPEINLQELEDSFSFTQAIGRDWQLAFIRNANGWLIDCDFDLSIFLSPLDER